MAYQQVKLAPPIIESKIAAQAESQGQQRIVVPFLMNRAVGWSQFYSVKILIKTVQSSNVVASYECKKDALIFKDGKYWATFTTGDVFTVGQSYKFQLAYTSIDDNHLVGHYSSVATFKFTYAPVLTIRGLDAANLNTHIYNYTGVYENKDQSERVYTYRFDLYNDNGEQIATSGDQLHNASKDTLVTSSIDEWSVKYVLNDEKNYILIYSVTTTNGLQWQSQSYRIYNGTTFNSSMSKYCNLIAETDFDDACVKLSLVPKGKQSKRINGQFLLLRASDEDSFSSWHEITKFFLSAHNAATAVDICKDYTVAQGVTYKYAIQAYNDQGVYANRQLSEPNSIMVDFEDMFLSDGERQLKIRFNPKVTSFKNTLLESKMDTLGGKYPFFFRNGNTSYKEFPISGLISVLMDTEGSFASGISFTAPSSRTDASTSRTESIPSLPTNLTGENIYKEREFKMEVLQWLINGKPKLFRSPTEGNYIVRLMNTSLSPNDTLGRMLHTFTCTAYEIDDFNFENLRKHKLMVDDYVEMRELAFKTIKLGMDDAYDGKVNDLNACIARLETKPGTIFEFLLKHAKQWETVVVGRSGVYIFDPTVLATNELIGIRPNLHVQNDAKEYWDQDTVLTYATYQKADLNQFTQINKVIVKDKIAQFNGDNKTLLDKLVDKKQITHTVGSIYFLRVGPRPIIPIESATDDGTGKYRFIKRHIEYNPTPEVVLRLDIETENGIQTYYYDGATRKRIEELNCIFELKKGNSIDMSGLTTDSENLLAKQLGLKSSLRNVDGGIIFTNIAYDDEMTLIIGNGLFVDIAYQEINRIYTIETDTNSDIYKYKRDWIDHIGYENESVYKERYYTALYIWYDSIGEENIIDAI